MESIDAGSEEEDTASSSEGLIDVCNTIITSDCDQDEAEIQSFGLILWDNIYDQNVWSQFRIKFKWIQTGL